jgi:hypothetical protein
LEQALTDLRVGAVRISVMTARRGAVAYLCLACAIAGTANAAPSTGGTTPPSMHRAAGWTLVHRSRSQPWLSGSMIVAVTAPDLGAVRPFAPFASLTQLSPSGILVWATTIGRHRPTFAAMRWPPRLSSFRVDHGWEGQPAASVQQRLKWGVVDGWDMDVRVYFGTQHPDAQLLRKAQAQLDRLVLPSR